MTLTRQRSARNKDPPQYLLTVEQMIENDYPVPLHLTDVFKKPDGWIETAWVGTCVVSEARTVYAIDCESVSTSHRVRSTNNDSLL